MLIRVGLLVMVASWLGSAQAANTTVQKWVDSKGNVHFGDKPPNTVEPVEMVIRTNEPPPPVSGASGDSGQGKSKQAAGESEACKEARKQLADYTRAPLLYEVDAEGKKHIMLESQRQELLEGIEERVKANCE